jgi:hypothetical protein
MSLFHRRPLSCPFSYLLLAVGTLLLHHIQQRHSLLCASINLPSTLTASHHHPFCFQSCALRHLDLVHFRESFTRLSGYSLLHLSLEQYSETLLLCFQCLIKYPTLPFSPHGESRHLWYAYSLPHNVTTAHPLMILFILLLLLVCSRTSSIFYSPSISNSPNRPRNRHDGNKNIISKTNLSCPVIVWGHFLWNIRFRLDRQSPLFHSPHPTASCTNAIQACCA